MSGTRSALPGRTRLYARLGDNRLARYAADGDTEAFSAIYSRYGQALYRYCSSIVRNSHDANDAFQSTMLAAFRGLNASDRRIDLRPWLFRIGHNEAISLIRRRRFEAEATEEQAGTAPSAAADFDLRAQMGELVADLWQLPERQRGMLVMRELSGLSVPEIAETFDTSHGAVNQTLFEARKSLHEFGQGRLMDHDKVRAAIRAGDGRRLRGRKLSAHLRDCPECRDAQLAQLGPRSAAAGGGV